MKMKIFLIVVFIVCLLLILVKTLVKNSSFKNQGRVCFDGHCFDVELAVTPVQKSLGLMFREKLDSQEGMLFVFNQEGQHSFWMKNTLIPLDIIWINKDQEIVFISENTQPCKKTLCPMVKPTENAKYVLEINGGLSKEIGLMVGDRAEIEY